MTTLYLGLALANAPSVSLLSAPEFRDDFTSSGNLNGRTGWTVETRPGFSGQVNSMAASGGVAGGTTGTAAFALNTASVETVRVTMRTGRNNCNMYHHVNVDATDANRDWINAGYGQATSGGLLTGNLTLAKTVNATGSNISIVSGIRPETWDVFESVFTEVAGVKYFTPYQNGFQVGAPIDITSWGGAFNKKHGIIGNSGADTMDVFQVADPATQQTLRLYQPRRTIPLNSDGTATLQIRVEYSLGAPSGLYATVYDRSTGSDVVVSGLNGVAVSNFAASAGVATGTVTMSAAQLSSGGPFWCRIEQRPLLAGGVSYAEGPVMTPGLVIGNNGQSLAVAVGFTTTTDAYAQPTNSWVQGGAPTNVSTLGLPYTRRLTPISANTTTAAMANALYTLNSKRCTIVTGGVGGTAIASRGVGSACHNAILEQITRLGRFNAIFHTDGQSDVSTATATYVAAVNAIYDDIATNNGGSILVGMNPIAAGWNTAGGTDENWQDIRRAQWKLTVDNPTRYFLGANTLDLQKADNLHLTENTYAVMGIRMMYALAKARGEIANDRNGPSLYSLTRVDATTLYAVYDLNGADSLELANTSYASEFHGGMSFSTAATKSGGTIATKLYPTGATVDASPSGGRQGITFTFAANTFPGTAYAWAAYGKDPFNPNNTAAIQTDMAGKASMIRGVYSDGTKVGLQPRFTTDSLDYMSAS